MPPTGVTAAKAVRPAAGVVCGIAAKTAGSTVAAVTTSASVCGRRRVLRRSGRSPCVSLRETLPARELRRPPHVRAYPVVSRCRATFTLGSGRAVRERRAARGPKPVPISCACATGRVEVRPGHRAPRCHRCGPVPRRELVVRIGDSQTVTGIVLPGGSAGKSGRQIATMETVVGEEAAVDEHAAVEPVQTPTPAAPAPAAPTGGSTNRC